MSTQTVHLALRRLSFTFAGDGSHAACLAAGADGGWYAESWRLPAEGPAVPTALPSEEGLRAQLLALPDGRVLVCRHDGDRHALVLLAAGEPEVPLAAVRTAGLRMLAVPGGAAAGPGAPVAVLLGTDTRPVTTVWLLAADGSAPREVAQLPGLHGGGVWLDVAGRLLALDRVVGGMVKTVVLDLELGTATPLLELGESSNDRLVLFDPATGFGMLRSDAPGVDRLGWALIGGGEPVRFPDCLHQPGRLLRPVASAPGLLPGAEPQVVLQVDHGAASALVLWRAGEKQVRPLPVPPGRLGAVGHWSAAGLRMPYSAPDRPAALATLDVAALLDAPDLETGSAPAGWRLDGSTVPGDGGRWLSARCLELPGPAGPVESVVYGGDGWLSAPHLVLALHGGPADAWRLEFDPALQRMAADGLAVLAPNQRGSTGYGPEYAMAIRGAWGGPDLEDVLALLADVAGRRAAAGLEPPALFGVSYGAFLALLAAAHAPAGSVSRCAVVAPFLSGGRLLAEASAPVRALTTRLGGDRELWDARGPRDVLRVADRLRAPLLVVHGDRDEVVPVGQSRSLRHELLRLGRVEGVDFRYVEATGAGHEVLAEEGAAAVHELLAGFLRTGRPT
ncbi:prolyl oligopeptidase family serine peptidase [Kitasatospora sp. NA04385]|uniref:alpha/beta hydrolase family protein n=1 Tax=Kitasatospora sp. NA04385 TaxID=2742135 RepID=UPI0015905F5D|nr:alpha/beta fold hydrolase [Kitasatospora sp. NA04385]QKW19379.1 prolyl oligopeptidase family serine peptidase [Kitasatospora sp. NA04385]